MSRFEPRGPRKELPIIERRYRTWVDNLRDGVLIFLLLLLVRVLMVATEIMIIRIPVVDRIAAQIWRLLEPYFK